MTSSPQYSKYVKIMPDLIERTDMGAFVGPIWFSFESFAFPAHEWSDFPVVILSWWLRSICKLIEKSSSIECLRFMDGPFELIIEQVGETEWRVVGRRRADYSAGHESEMLSVVTASEFAMEILAVARVVLHHCEQNSWTDNDVFLLRHAILDLGSALEI